MTKIIGVRQAVKDIKSCPRGFHVELWSYLDDHEDVRLYTSEYLSQNSWTNPDRHKGEKRIIWTTAYEDDMKAHSLTECIKAAAADAWGLSEISGPDKASGIKTIRRSGGALVVSITDLAKAVDAAEGDIVDVTISIRD